MNNISKEGEIIALTDKIVKVRYLCASACRNCPAQNLCPSHENQNKEIEITRDKDKIYQIGDKVKINLQERSGWLAIIVAYIIPLVIILGFISYGTTERWSELTTATIGLLIVPVYYILLNRMSKRLQTMIKIEIQEKQSQKGAEEK